MEKDKILTVMYKKSFMAGNVICIMVAAFIVYGCAHRAAEVKTTKDYPSSRYLTAKGIGQSESEARNRAVSEMSRIFESSIFSDTLDRVTSKIDESGSEVSRQSIESNIRIVSFMELKGVRVEETWFNDDTGVYYALAVLDRHQARNDWLKQISEMDSRIEGEFGVLGGAGSKYERFRSLKSILGLWIEREVFVSRLNVLGFNDKRSASYDIERVFSMIPKARNDLLIFIDINGENATVIKDRVSAVLSESGFALSDNRNGSNVMIEGNIEIVPIDLKNPDWEFARATVSISVIDLHTGMKVGEIIEKKRAGHLTYEEAVHKAVKMVSDPVSEKLLKYFEE